MKDFARLLGLCLVFSVACSKSPEIVHEAVSDEPKFSSTPEETMPPIPDHIANFTSSELCSRLISVDTLPTRNPIPTDPIYESLIAKGDDAIPCLIEKIPDTTHIPDPRYSVPVWQNFAVGDTAVIVLLDIASKDDSEWEKLMLEMLPPKAEKEWETNGIYAYFNYVSEPKNRKELQKWWKKRLLNQNKLSAR